MTVPAVETRSVAVHALVGTMLLALLVLGDVQRLGGHPLGLVQPGERGPAAELIHDDFPDVELPDSLGLDGQMTYAMARDAWSVDAPSDSLDRPRYRLQRPLLSWVAGTVHPGPGMGLVWTLFGLGLTAVAAGAWATGRLSVSWGGPPWVAALFPVLPGTFMAVRVTTSDAVGVALALLAVALAARGRTTLAVGIGVAAVLAKEPTLLVLAGWALAHRTPRHIAVAVVPAAVGGAWMVGLRILVPGAEGLNGDIGLPFVGLLGAAIDIWSEGRELWGLAGTVLALVLGITALARRGLRHPLGAAVVLHLAFLLVAGSNPLGTSFGGTRTGLALTALAMIALATPDAPPVPGLRRAPGGKASATAGTAPTADDTAAVSLPAVAVSGGR
ncbi:hypothetical protein [Iamia sp. SCSIO 61187]|uniref:hypothetical protein n=1 Tax=Iamia sp. SCSIO 61187 TaxID=2722752 RepID=UPI001C62C50B|nr:hypothetical protein [Iamia sp. SCSIO 61187]